MKSKILLICFSFIFLFAEAQDSEKMYKINWKVDIPLTLGAAGGTALGFALISGQEGIDSTTLANLDKNDINGFDRPVAGNYDLDAEKQSDALFFASFPYGLVLLADKKARQEAGTIGLMYLQTISLSSMSYSLAAGNTNRYRPYTYIQDQKDNEDLQGDRRSLHARNSFYGGHPATVTASTVFVAKVYSDLHPESNFKYVLWGVAGGASIATAALRVKAGKHFYSDVIAGVGVSAAIGYLVPHLHKTKKAETSLNIMPYTGESTGVYMTYVFKKKTKDIIDFQL